jgi:diadenosine tetraphosphate (Ap4A) HIT family hydrolase
MFELDKTLKKDTFFVKDLELCQLLLLNNKHYPWLVLVPKRADKTEIFELSEDEQILLSREVNKISKMSKEIFKADKINIAAFGNVVSQLHIHIISRYKNDRVFPDPVWLDKEKKEYGNSYEKEIIKKINSWLTLSEK